MTKEALKLALEALEASHFLIHGSETKGGLAFCMDGYYSGCFDIDSNDKQTNKAITAIKEALAQPEQEPVAIYRAGQAKGEVYHVQFLKEMEADEVLLYAAPAQRTWVGLTDGEVDKMILLMGFPPDWITENAIVKNIVRNLEAKLKDKNT